MRNKNSPPLRERSPLSYLPICLPFPCSPRDHFSIPPPVCLQLRQNHWKWMGVCLDPVHETPTLDLSQAVQGLSSYSFYPSSLFAPCQLKVLAPRSYLLVEHIKIMVFFVIFIYLIHSYGSLIEELYLKFSTYMLATFLSSKRQAEVVDEK